MKVLIILIFLCTSCLTAKNELGLLSMDKVMTIKMTEKGELKTFDGDPEPTMPDMKKNDETIAGVDSDNDGIRDDIEIWINRNFKTANERRAFKQYAAIKMLWIIKKEKGATDEEMQNMHQPSFEAILCVSFIFKHADLELSKNETDLQHLLMALIINNEIRVNMFALAVVASRGGSGSDNGVDLYNSEIFCKFKVENLDEIKTYWKSLYKK